MEKFIPRRKIRAVDLRQAGFLPFEARALSHIPENVPYLQEMKDARLKDFSRFARHHKSYDLKVIEKDFEKMIIRIYRRKGWWKGKNERSVFAMLRENSHGEDAYKRKDKNYKSPWVDRGKKNRDLTGAIERGFEKRGK